MNPVECEIERNFGVILDRLADEGALDRASRLESIVVDYDRPFQRWRFTVALGGGTAFCFTIDERRRSASTGAIVPPARELTRLWWRCYENDRVHRELQRRWVRLAEEVIVGVDPGSSGGDETGVVSLETLEGHIARFHQDPLALAPSSQRLETATEIIARQRYLRYRAEVRFGLGENVRDVVVETRSIELLRERLSSEQRAAYDRDRAFEVKGCDTGKRYRIRHGRQMNIEELDARGRRVAGLCFLPEGGLVAGDCMLAQKIALETAETKTLAVANRF